MRGKRPISVYTPSNTDPETRERIFVQRHKLLERVVSWCEESMLTGDKHHLLFIGPRGCGKTHLVSMAHDRLSRNAGLTDKMRIAWLGEDNVFTGLIDFALEIADELSSEYPDEFRFDYRNKARSLSADDAADLIFDEIFSRLGDRSILIIMENLDRAFHGFGDTGQKRWRAILQEKRRVATLATSQQLSKDLSSRDAAFYGFFDITHLEPLSVDDARELMAKIARENDEHDLVEFLTTPEGRFRVRALHHLAGGNHRMYIMLSEFLTKESLDGLVAAFEQLAEDLTPYFQERVGSLPPQQARIVQSLCNATGAMTVKEVSEDTFIPEGNVSKQLGELKIKGYAISQKRGKESFYEMAEPLMRLCLEVKKQRGKPLKLVADFLRAWYLTKSLQVEFEAESGIPANRARSLAYKRTALQSNDAFQQVISRKLEREFESSIEGKHFDAAMNIAEELVFADRPTGIIRKSRVLRAKGQLSQALAQINEAISLPDLAANQKAEALFSRGVTYGQLDETEKAIADYSAVIEMEEAPADQKAMAMFNRGVTYSQLGETEKEIADYSAVIEMEEAPIQRKADAMINRGIQYWQSQHFELSLNDFTAVAGMIGVSSSTTTYALFCIPEAMIPIKPLDESVESLQRAFDDGDSKTSDYGGQPRDILQTIIGREYRSWGEFIEKLIPIYAQNGALSLLGSGLTESIAVFDDDPHLESQLDLWNSIWQKFGAEHEELTVSLSALAAAVRVIKTGNDRPLFDLPLEIREIVRPLLKNSLSRK